MALCSLCRSIPFRALPEPPKPLSYHRVLDQPNLIEFSNTSLDDEQPPPIESVVSWHANLEALAESARHRCPLCLIVQTAVQSWKDCFEKAATSDPAYEEFKEYNQVDLDRHPLWLTKRPTGGDGLAVFSWNAYRYKSSKSLDGVIPLASIAFATEASSPLAATLSVRPAKADSGSLEVQDVAASWVRDCCESHERCASSDMPLPTRLLDIGAGSDQVIKLIEPEPGQKGRYATLSYCWGCPQTSVTTTRDSHQAHISGISVANLPKTFQDAITITRHLGLRHLWIDSLCIFQDDQDDWSRESARMLEVYSNAHVAIAANRSQSSADGCFHNRMPRSGATIDFSGLGEVQARLVDLSDEMRWGLAYSFTEEPLSSRCWALQERVLSRRILHYNSNQLYFECNHGVVSEDGCRSSDRFCDMRLIRQSEASEAQIRNTWHSILWNYGERDLSRPTDKLPALSGLARLVRTALNDQYVAGLWSRSLIEGLAWQGLGKQEPESATEYIAPSWSWASYKGIAATGLRGSWRSIARVEEWHVDLRNKDEPCGQISNAWIRVRGPLLQLEPSKVATTDHDERLKRAQRTPHLRFTTKYACDEEGARLSLDYREKEGYREQLDLHSIKVLILGGHLVAQENLENTTGDELGGALNTAYGLALIPSQSGENAAMKRIGWMFIDGEEVGKAEKNEGDWDTVTII